MHRDPLGTGKLVAGGNGKEPLPGQPPAWVSRSPDETVTQWRDRIEGEFWQWQLSQGFRHDLVALKRHELAAKHLWPIRSELDITARHADAEWMRALSDEELMALAEIRDRAKARMQAQVPATVGSAFHEQWKEASKIEREAIGQGGESRFPAPLVGGPDIPPETPNALPAPSSNART